MQNRKISCLNQLQILGVEGNVKGTHQESAGLRSEYAIGLLDRRGRCSPTCREANVNGIVLLLQWDALRARLSLPRTTSGSIYDEVRRGSDVSALHIMSAQSAMFISAGVNQRAAKWTGVAEVLSALGSVFGVL
jgi:hypothetical protein